MGAGKSTALAAAREAGLETIEIDELMEARARQADPARRSRRTARRRSAAREAEVVGSLLEQADGGAIALGGGSVLSERIREALGRHIVVWLEVDAAEAWRRIEGTDRPLATSEEDVERAARRAPAALRRAGRRGGADGGRRRGRRALPAIQALAEMPAGTRLLWASSASGDYPVFVGPGLLGERLVAAGRAGASASPTARRRRSTPSGSSRSSEAVEVEPGEEARRWRRPRRSCASWRALG